MPQLFDVITGDMGFVCIRLEVTKYVEQYTDEMYATLLLPAGITSEASIRCKDKSDLLNKSRNVDKTYVDEVLSRKKKCNLQSIKSFCFINDIAMMIRTMFAILGKDYE